MPVADKFYFVSTFRVIGKMVSRNSDIVQTRGQDYKGNSNNVFVRYICLILEFIVLSRDLWYLRWNTISLSQILRKRRKMRLLTNFIFPFPSEKREKQIYIKMCIQNRSVMQNFLRMENLIKYAQEITR
jgi:hypothetical protein